MKLFYAPVRRFRFACLMLLVLLIVGAAWAQSPPAEKFNTEVPKDIIILGSTREYNGALVLARQAAAKLRRKLDLRGLRPVGKLGLTMSRKDCLGAGGGDDLGYPCYQARGDGNAQNDDYISIEYSNAYKGFATGLYIVVAGITDVKSPALQRRLAAIRVHYPQAYAKRTYVWFGCMH